MEIWHHCRCRALIPSGTALHVISRTAETKERTRLAGKGWHQWRVSKAPVCMAWSSPSPTQCILFAFQNNYNRNPYWTPQYAAVNRCRIFRVPRLLPQLCQTPTVSQCTAVLSPGVSCTTATQLCDCAHPQHLHPSTFATNWASIPRTDDCHPV